MHMYPLQLSTGEVLVQYNNGEQMKLNPTGVNSGAVHTDTHGHQARSASYCSLLHSNHFTPCNLQVSKQQSHPTKCESKTFPLSSSSGLTHGCLVTLTQSLSVFIFFSTVYFIIIIIIILHQYNIAAA